MGLGDFLDYKKRKSLYIFGVVILALNNIVWTKDLTSSFMGIKIFGAIDIATLAGLLVLYGSWMFYNRRGIG